MINSTSLSNSNLYILKINIRLNTYNSINKNPTLQIKHKKSAASKEAALFIK
jgi:hypothetical protein